MPVKKKLPTSRTPVGVAVYPHLNKPDTKFDTETGGKYRVKLSIPAKECGAFIKEIDKVYEQNIVKEAEARDQDVEDIRRANKPYTEEKVDGKKTGNILISFSMKAKGKAKDGTEWEQRPQFFDGSGNNMPHDKLPQIGGGTKMCINCTLAPWFVGSQGAGVTLRINAIQIIELVEYGGNKSANDFGFDTSGEAIELEDDTTTEEVVMSDDMDGDEF